MSWQSEFNKFLAADYKNYAVSRRNIFTLFEILFWPMISLISIGLMTRYLALGKEELAFLFIGDMALTLLQVTQMDIAYVLFCEIWFKSIKADILPGTLSSIVLLVCGFNYPIGVLPRPLPGTGQSDTTNLLSRVLQIILCSRRI